MYSTISDDLSREHLALEAAKCLKNIFANSQNVTVLHKELLEINLSITAYIEESKKRLEALRLDLANQATSSHKVVEILNEKQSKMSNTTQSPQKCNNQSRYEKCTNEDNNNSRYKVNKHHSARTFITWFNHMIDNDRPNICLYLSNDATLEWFGRTIKTRKKLSAFLKYDMQCSRHDFTTVESIDKIQTRQEIQRTEKAKLSPNQSPEVANLKSERRGKRRLLRSNCNSPEWAEGCQPAEEGVVNKKFKTDLILSNVSGEKINESVDKLIADEVIEVNNRGDSFLARRVKRKCMQVTPPNAEKGQGDCLPSTSGTDSDRSHEALNAQLPRLAVECNGYIEFTRSKNSRSVDCMKWERKCKVQISYSEDPLNIGEYIIWNIRYHDESKCRRNLLAAFEEVAKEEEGKQL